jgi:hypothetical protein
VEERERGGVGQKRKGKERMGCDVMGWDGMGMGMEEDRGRGSRRWGGGTVAMGYG